MCVRVACHCVRYNMFHYVLLTHVQNRLSISSPCSDFCPSEGGAPPVCAEHDYPVFCAADLSGEQQGSPEATDGHCCEHVTSPWYSGAPYGCYPQHGLSQQQSYGCSGLDFPSLFEPSPILSEKQYYPRPLGFKPVGVMNMGTCVCDVWCSVFLDTSSLL